MAILAIFISFIFGAFPFSVWVAKLGLKVDIREYGDGNPGATNVYRAGGKAWGALALLLDFAKGAIPVAIGNFGLGLDGWLLTAVAIAPVLGHAISPFLRFKGGKALAVTFGVWTGLTLFIAPMILGIAFAIWMAILVIPGWGVVMGMITLLLFFLIFLPKPVLLGTWLGIMIILVWKHIDDLKVFPRLQNGALGFLWGHQQS